MTKNSHPENSIIRQSDLAPNPFEQFKQWLEQAVAAQLSQPYAAALATATKEGQPAARMVIVRDFDERGFVFYTHYDSPKGQELAQNPKAALVFYWAALERQIQVIGAVSRVSTEESDRFSLPGAKRVRLSHKPQGLREG